jgi:hypothetical protein
MLSSRKPNSGSESRSRYLRVGATTGADTFWLRQLHRLHRQLHAKDSLCPKVYRDVATAVAKVIGSACELDKFIPPLAAERSCQSSIPRLMLLRGNHQQNIVLIHDVYTLVMVLGTKAHGLSPAPYRFRRRVSRVITRLAAHSQTAVDVRSPAVSEPMAAQIHQTIIK